MTHYHAFGGRRRGHRRSSILLQVLLCLGVFVSSAFALPRAQEGRHDEATTTMDNMQNHPELRGSARRNEQQRGRHLARSARDWWSESVTVCRKTSRKYRTQEVTVMMWRLWEVLKTTQGALGACKTVCPCGPNGHCGNLTQIKNDDGTKGDKVEYSCNCDKGYEFNGINCTKPPRVVETDLWTTFKVCGGIPGELCVNGFSCVDDPTDACNPDQDGGVAVACPGRCVPQCGGILASPACPTGLQCVADDPFDDCNPNVQDAACPGICVPRSKPFFPYCQGDTEDATTCKAGFTCMRDVRKGCGPGLASACIGTCEPVCGGFAGFACPDAENYVCIDDTRDDCDPFNGGADCLGLCVEIPEKCGGPNKVECPSGYKCTQDPNLAKVADLCGLDGEDTTCTGVCAQACAGLTPAPQPGCPEGFSCIDDPARPDCLIAADCTGVCWETKDDEPVAGSTCGGLQGKECPEGYACTNNPKADCQLSTDGSSSDCEGVCAPSCGGLRPPSDVPDCPVGTTCMDNPARPDCLLAADCPGVCLDGPGPSPMCSTVTGEGCPDGYACAFDSNRACIALVGVECPGICAQQCGGIMPGPLQICPDGTSCVDNAATPDCLIAADCLGVCLPSDSVDNPALATCTAANSPNKIDCPDGYKCTHDPRSMRPNLCDLDGNDDSCRGICVQACAGLTVGSQQGCADGFSCIDDPARPDCLIAADCTGICWDTKDDEPVAGSTCGGLQGKECPDGFACTNNPKADCQLSADGSNSDCEGVCAPSCGGLRPPSDVPDCPDGTTCMDNPARPDCLLAADCPGVCLEGPGPSPMCSTVTGEGCPDGYACAFDSNRACIALAGVECPGICARQCGGMVADSPLQICPDGTSCVDNAATPDCLIAADCLGVCLPTQSTENPTPPLPATCTAANSPNKIDCPDGFKCTHDPRSMRPNLCNLDGNDESCRGICAPACAGLTVGSQQQGCAEGLTCIDDPARPDCLIAADCAGICWQSSAEPVYSCGGPSFDKCPNGYACTNDPLADCQLSTDGSRPSNCGKVCAKSCGGLRPPSDVPDCPDGSTCMDNPATPKCLLAADCLGVCMVTSGSSEPPTLQYCESGERISSCPDGWNCTDDITDDCDPTQGGLNCAGHCTDSNGNGGTTPPDIMCSTGTGEGCPDGYACAFDSNRACIALAGVECPGICARQCGGMVADSPLQTCPGGTQCVDNAATPDCLMAADCLGVCLPMDTTTMPLFCSTLGSNDSVECPDGMVCVDDDSDECEPFTGGENCALICAPLPERCSGDSGQICPKGYTCTNDPLLNCTLTMNSVQCTGICAQTCGGERVLGAACPKGQTCANDPAAEPGCLIEVDCPGICVDDNNDNDEPTPLSCGGFGDVPCADGLVCVDDPSDNCDNGTTGADCPGICVDLSNDPPTPSSSCSTTTGKGCPDGFGCTFDTDIACIQVVGFDCPGKCVPSCGGLLPGPSLQSCPDGTSCVDNPARPDCLLAADCPGVCLSTVSSQSTTINANDNATTANTIVTAIIPCTSAAECPHDGMECVDDPNGAGMCQ